MTEAQTPVKTLVKCEYAGCESTMVHVFDDGSIQCVQCGGWQKKTKAVAVPPLEGATPL